MLVVGLTGGIGCGKSTVSSYLAANGIKVIDCDLIALHAAHKGTWGYRRILAAFGNGILTANGDIDRVALGQLVFSDAQARRRLNRATHLPVALELLRQLLLDWLLCNRILVVDMPLLFETGSHKFTSCNIVVACKPAIQRRRVMLRDQSTAAEAQARMDSQMPLTNKVQAADYVLNNNGSIEDLQQQVDELLCKLHARANTWKHALLSPLACAGVVTLVLLPTVLVMHNQI